MWGSYSSISSMVHLCFFRSSRVANRCTFCWARSPYGMGWRMATTFLPSFCSAFTTARLVWLLPQPVRTAHTDTTGFVDWTMVASGPIRRKSAPLASTRDALCITTSWGTSL